MAKKKLTEKLVKNIQGLSAYQTFPLAGDYKRDPRSGTTTPSVEAVDEARDWVNHNKK